MLEGTMRIYWTQQCPLKLKYNHWLVFSLFTENNAKIVTEERGLQDVVKVMETHSDVSDVIEAACSALWSLSMEGKFNCSVHVTLIFEYN